MRDQKTFRIGISGSYGGFNLGDEAILQGIISQLRRSLPVEITVFSRDAEDTRRRHAVERVVPVRQLSREEILPEVLRLDLLILGGGGILFDAEAHIYLREVAMANERGIPVLVYAISAGPLDKPEARQLVRDSLNRAAVVSVRERDAKRLLDELGVEREIHVTADPALLLEPESLPSGAIKREGLDGRKRRLVGMSVRETGPAAPDIDEAHYQMLLANTADYIVERFDADILFIPMERRMQDVQQSHAVVSKMTHAPRATVLKGEYTSGQVLSMVGRLEFAVGMRLHFLIFAALQRVPFVALPYSGKVSGFLEDLEFASPPMQRVNAGRLIAHIDRCWDFRRDLQAAIDRRLPLLQRRAHVTNELAVQLLEQGAIRPSEAAA